MLAHVLSIRRLAKILVGTALLFAAAAPTASAHIELPSAPLDAFHPLGAPVAEPWLSPGEALETSSADAAFTKAKAGIVIGGADTKVECIGDGTSGKRVQVLYVHDVDKPDNYATKKADIGAFALGADRIYRNSAAKTQGPHRIRFVHDAYCNLSIVDVAVDDPADFTGTATPFADLKTLVQAAGFTDPDRKYIMFLDSASVVCGVAGRPNDDSAGQSNLANGSPAGSSGYSRIDFTMPGCRTSDRVMAHEFGHTLGAVQLSAPNSNGSGHCTDESDRLCQNDGPPSLPTVSVCTGPNDDDLLDCNNDDYFNAHPAAGSYLDTHWNLARSDFLASNPPSQWGYVKASDPTNAGPYTPSPDHNQNSTNQKNTIVRTGTGSYEVTFTDLANFDGEAGTVLVTSLGTMGEHCNDSRWSSNGTPDTTVTVHCWTAAGALVDSQFTAAYIRPTSSPGDFAYLWLDDEVTSAVGYTPSLFHQFNSTGGVNTTTRNAVGDYTVRLAGLASDGGTVKVTAFSGGANYCKSEWWAPSGADELVEVRCFNSAGAAVNSKFTLAWADSQSILSNGADSAYVYSTTATPMSSYTPPAATNYNSSGALNTVTRNGLGSYTVTVPNLGSSFAGINRGTVHVTATMATNKRCEVTGWTSPFVLPGAPIPVLVDVTCTTSAGAVADSKFVLQFTK